MHFWRLIHLKRLSLFLVLVVFAAVLGVAQVRAQFSQELPPVDVTLDVGDTILTVEGQAPPSSFVTFLKAGSPIGTITADSAGNFTKSFTAQTQGLNTISVYAKSGDQTTDTVSKTINLVVQAETTVNFFLPTTLSLSASQVAQGSPITFSGITIPNGEVTLTLNNNFQASVTASSSGAWSYVLNTDQLYIGMHQLFAVVSDGLGNQSSPTSKRAFQVLSENAPAPTPKQIPVPEITSPHNNQRFSGSAIVVAGIALANSQIELWEGEEAIGSAFANQLGEWQIDVFLTKPKHELKARACVSSVCSGFSGTVAVFYDAADPSASINSLFLELGKYRYADVRVNKQVTLDLLFGGGTKPYELQIDWGSTDIERMTLERGGNMQLKHQYSEPGSYNGVLTLKDDKGAIRVGYFSVQVVERGAVPPAVVATAIVGGAAAVVYFAIYRGLGKIILRFIVKIVLPFK